MLIRDREHVVVVEGATAAGTGTAGRSGVVACGTLVIEHKFIHGGMCVGHIEDVVVDASARGQGLGRRLLLKLVDAARAAGCYKAILNCKEENKGFYERCGFAPKELSMACYF